MGPTLSMYGTLAVSMHVLSISPVMLKTRVIVANTEPLESHLLAKF